MNINPNLCSFRRSRYCRIEYFVGLLLSAVSVLAAPFGTEFSYQGRLDSSSGPASGLYDFTFGLHMTFSGGTAMVTITNANVGVSKGVFTTAVDFGAGIFNGTAYWLQLGVRTNGSATFTPLSPRQSLTSTPNAQYATLAGDVGGTLADSRLSANVALRAGGNPFTGNQSIMGGKLGLGTTVPSRQLEIQAPGDVELGLKSTDLNGRLWTLQSSGNGTPGREQTFQIIDRTAGASRLLINSNGNVGIGTANPATALEVNGTISASSFTGSGAGLANVNALTLGGVSGSTFWKTTGNSGTTAGTHFLGTIDNQALELKVNGTRALRLEPNSNGAPNVIGGSSNNFAALGIVGATIGGGGAAGSPGFATTNKVTADFATVAGGLGNSSSSIGATVGGGQGNNSSGVAATVGGGLENASRGSYATVGGGNYNSSNGEHPTVSGGGYNVSSGFSPTVSGGWRNYSSTNFATVGGGQFNTSSGDSATVGGGYYNSSTNGAATIGGGQFNISGGLFATVGGGVDNTSSGYSATVGGGYRNTNSGDFGMVPGGRENSAAGAYSFAAGRQAKASHDGAFVWADSQAVDFESTASNQFSLRALGGVRLSDDTPNLSFGNATRQMLNLSGSQYGIGVQSDTLYYRCDATSGASLAGFRWYKGGTHQGDLGNAGGGIEMMSLTELGHYVRGTFVSVSDRNAKENFKQVDTSAVLAKVAGLPLSEWNYKQDASSRHLGPMAQDFYAAFHVGPDDKHIATVDESGVALAAIQGLNQKVDSENATLRAENADLKQRLEKLEQMMNREQGEAR